MKRQRDSEKDDTEVLGLLMLLQSAPLTPGLRRLLFQDVGNGHQSPGTVSGAGEIKVFQLLIWQQL